MKSLRENYHRYVTCYLVICIEKCKFKKSKYDLRDWDSEHKKIGKRVTLSVEELKKLRDVLNGWTYKANR